MFCPNCRFENQKNIEFCLNCGAKLGKGTDNLNLKNKIVQCRYCGYLSELPRCEHCGRWIDKSVRPSKIESFLDFISGIPGELKSFKWDDTFLKRHFVGIVVLMGLIAIMLLVMNYI